MAVVVGEAAVRLRPETSGFRAEAEGEVDSSLPGVAKKAAGIFAAAFAAVKIGEFLGGAIEQASELSESASKVGVVFGDAAGSVQEFAKQAATSMGQSEAQALAATGTFGNLLRSIGLTEQQSADMSTSMVQLASDLASFNNTDVDTALEALRSGLVGESEPLKQFGVNLNQAAIEAEAMRLGIAKTKDEVTGAVQSQAVYSLIMKQTALAQGDFARTSGGWANQQRILAAQTDQLSANIGGVLVPALALGAQTITAGLMPRILDLTSNLPNLGNALGALVPAFHAAFEGNDEQLVGILNSTLGLGNGLVATAADAGEFAAIFGEAMADGKAGADLLAEDGLGGIAARAGVAAHALQGSFAAAFLSVQASVAPLWESLTRELAPTIASIRAAIGGIFSGLDLGGGGGIAGFGAAIGGALQAIVPVVSGVLNHFLGIAQQVLPIIADLFVQLVPIVQQVFAQIGPIISALLPILQEISGVYMNALITAFQALMPVIPPLAAAIGQVVQILGGALLSIIQQLAPIIPQLVTVIAQLAAAFGTALGGVLQALVPILPTLAKAFGQIAEAVAGALMDVLSALIPILPPIAEAFGAIATALAGALAQALNAILPILPTLINALIQLVVSAITPLLPILPILANLFSVIIQALAPLIPPIVQIVTLLIQLAVAAITPLMPIITVLIGIFTKVLEILSPIIEIVVGVIGVFVQLASTLISVVVGAVSGVVGVFQGLWTGISRVVSNIVSGVTSTWRGFVDGLVSIVSGIGSTISGIFSGIGGIIKGALNGVISLINNTIIWGVNKLIDGVNLVNPFDDIPHIPKIPTLHVGGVIDWGASGEGLALLRSRELVATPEQRALGEGLLEQLLTGTGPFESTAGTPAAGTGGPTVQVNVTQQPGEDGTVLAARVTQGVVWNLNAGITRRVGVGAEATS